MIFKKERNLQNKVFSTKISFVNYGAKDSAGNLYKAVAEQEEKLIDDFGAPTVKVGGQFIGHVKLEADKLTVKTFANASEAEAVGDAECITYVLADADIALDKTFQVEYSVTSKKEKATEKLTAEQVAEAKCLIFEDVIQKRAEAVITEFKKKTTSFETELEDNNSEEFTIPVVSAESHTHA